MSFEFKLPIQYVEHFNVSNDIIQNIDFDSIYLKTFNPETELGKNIVKKMYSFFTTNTEFLKDTQKLQCIKDSITINHSIINVFNKEFKNIQNIENFKNHFQYIDIKYLDTFNTNENVLQILGLYNFTSPIINLITPIFILIVPFFILKLKKIDITFNTYKNFLFETLFKKFNITSFTDSSFKTKFYLFITIIFYVVGIYQNIVSCINFYKNNKYINNFFEQTKQYLTFVNEQQQRLLTKINHVLTYKEFYNDVYNNNKFIVQKINELKNITKYNIGRKLSLFYKFKFDISFINNCKYSLECIGYLDNMCGMFNNKNLNKCFYADRTIFRNFYFPIENSTIIKNSCNLKKNYIISGPNASGKTTVIKSLILNVILSQQIGRGFYDKGCVSPYSHIHCYLNIPDTNNRDSLFQAEARQCKNIIDCIKSNNNSKHFVIFDELYSGTNPEQAVKSAYSYLKYLGELNNVTFLLTTHFYDLCHKINNINREKIVNISMKSKNTNNKTIYYYKLQKGISTVKSGFDILKDMNYPEQIINTLKNS